MSAYRTYLSCIQEKSTYRATWNPSFPLKIGQIIKLAADGTIQVQSGLQDEGLDPHISAGKPGADLDYSSDEGVKITIKVAGKAPVAGSAFSKLDAGISCSFEQNKAIVFQLGNYNTFIIDNLGALEKDIIARYNNGDWPKEWLIVTELIEADTATIMISERGNAAIDLKANAAATVADLKLTNAKLGLSIARSQGEIIKYITQSGLTPLYKVMGVRQPWLGFGTPGLAAKAAEVKKETEVLAFREQLVTEEELA